MLNNIINLDILNIERTESLQKIINDGNINTAFIELLVYDTNDVLINETIIPIIDIINSSLFVYSDKFIFNPGVHLRDLGYSNGTYKIKYNFFNKIVGDFQNNDVLVLKKISPSRTELEIFTPKLNSNIPIESQSLSQLNHMFMSSSNNELSYYAYFGSDRNYLIVNKMLFNDNVLIKLYEELPADIDTFTNFTIVKKLVDSYVDTITLHTQLTEDFSELVQLAGPKINYKSAGLTYRTTNLENFETLASTNDYKIDEIKRLYLSSSIIEGIDINIDYRDYSKFVHFSSAKQRLKNFRNKIKQIEFFDSKISSLTVSGSQIESASWGATPEISSSISYYKNQKNNILNTFDQYEYFMYYESGSYVSNSLGEFQNATWPKRTNFKPYYLYSVTSSEAIQWYNSMIISASEYDNLNPNILTNTIPIEIQLDDENNQYIKYVQMIGHLLDINYNYIDRMTSVHERQNCIFDGIPRELILPVINHYGFDLRSGNVVKGLLECIVSQSTTPESL